MLDLIVQSLNNAVYTKDDKVVPRYQEAFVPHLGVDKSRQNKVPIDRNDEIDLTCAVKVDGLLAYGTVFSYKLLLAKFDAPGFLRGIPVPGQISPNANFNIVSLAVVNKPCVGPDLEVIAHPPLFHRLFYHTLDDSILLMFDLEVVDGQA